MRMLDTALEESTSLHHLMTGVMDGGGSVIHAADERKFIGVFRSAGEILGDFDARDVGLDRPVRPADFDRRVRLHVERVELRRSAHQHQKDAIDVAIAVGRALGTQTEPVRETEAQRSESPCVQKIAPAQPIAELDGAVGVQAKHRRPPPTVSRFYQYFCLARNPSRMRLNSCGFSSMRKWSVSGISLYSSFGKTRFINS